MIWLIFILVCISVCSLIIVDDLEPFIKFRNRIGLGPKRLLRSKYKIVDLIIYTIWKVTNCAPCLSYHLTWILFVSFGSWWGFLFGFITYLISKFLYLKIWGLVSF